MIRDLIAHSGDILWPVAALVLFVLLFGGIVVWTYSGRRDRFHYLRMLPLQDELNASSSAAVAETESTARGRS